MRRFHLFEMEDQPWLPIVFRDFITDHLHYILSRETRKPLNQAIASRLQPLLARTGRKQIIDLCAGAGGPMLNIRNILAHEFNEPVEVILTDLFPNIEAFKKREAEGKGDVKARYEPVNALDVPPDLRGVRTLFSVLHHFKPEAARRLLADAVRKREPIAVFEPLERKLHILLFFAFTIFWHALIMTPIVGKMTWQRFLLTYLIPLAPACIWWDGMVSVLRTYTPEELRELAESVGAPDYQWEAGRFYIPGPFKIKTPTIYLIGFPKQAPIAE